MNFLPSGGLTTRDDKRRVSHASASAGACAAPVVLMS
eukprot:gene7447-8234_t